MILNTESSLIVMGSDLFMNPFLRLRADEIMQHTDPRQLSCSERVGMAGAERAAVFP